MGKVDEQTLQGDRINGRTAGEGNGTGRRLEFDTIPHSRGSKVQK